MHLGGELLVRADPEPHASRAGVVEALRVADVLEADREADPALDALAAGRVAGAAGQADRVARQLLGLRHRQRGGAADHLCHRQRARHLLPGRERVARPERVQQPQLDRVDLERGGELVHLRLVREAALDGAEAAHRAAGRVVRVDAGRLDQRVLDLVRADSEGGRVRADGRARRGVGAAVEQDPRADVDELAVAGRAVLHPDLGRVPVDVADERLLARVDDLHRPVGVQREHRAVDLHREVLAPAEGAADPGEVDPHLLLLEPEAGRDLVAVDVQPLRRHVDVDAALAVGHREPGLRPEEGLVLDPELVDALDADLAGGVRVAVADHDRAQDVRPRVVAEAVAGGRVLVVDRRLLHGALHVGHRLERLVLDPHLLGRPPRLLGMLGGDEGDRLAEVAHLVDREHRLVRELEPVGLRARARRRG